MKSMRSLKKISKISSSRKIEYNEASIDEIVINDSLDEKENINNFFMQGF
jgi:hypothetical protein